MSPYVFDLWTFTADELTVLVANHARGNSVKTSARVLHKSDREVRSVERYLGLRRDA